MQYESIDIKTMEMYIFPTKRIQINTRDTFTLSGIFEFLTNKMNYCVTCTETKTIYNI